MPILSSWPFGRQWWGYPFNDFHKLEREMRRLFDEAMDSFVDRRATSRRFPLTNVYETAESVVVEVAVPGVSVAELELSVTGDTLTLKGERKPELPEGATYVGKERHHGPFSRAVALPRSVDATQAKAEYADGILTVALPKAPEAKARTIQVKTG